MHLDTAQFSTWKKLKFISQLIDQLIQLIDQLTQLIGLYWSVDDWNNSCLFYPLLNDLIMPQESQGITEILLRHTAIIGQL